MKTLITLATVSVLTGCSLFTTPPFDNVEYDKFVRIHVGLTQIQKQCSDNDKVMNDVNKLMQLATETSVYTNNIANNSETGFVADMILDDVNEMRKQYDTGNGNSVYCDLKTTQTLIKVQHTMEVLSTKGR